jgi:Tol biopolymer transport system component
VLRVLRSKPSLKRLLKGAYQFTGNAMSDKKSTSVAAIHRMSANSREHLFGYYDKSPWSADDRRMIFLEVRDASHSVAPPVVAQIVLHDVDLRQDELVATTQTWNVQQGCMLQWFGDSSDQILYNDLRDGGYRAVVRDLETGHEEVLPLPVYSVSRDGAHAVSLDFSRLHTLRPGYGYANLPDSTRGVTCPDSTCMWHLDTTTRAVTPLFTYRDLTMLTPRESMRGAFHKVNHIMLSPSGTMFMFLHRWIRNGVKNHRLLLCRLDGREPTILLDSDLVSHCNWLDDGTIILFATTSEGTGYHLLDVDGGRTHKLTSLPSVDGHPSVSPDGEWLVTDTYPDFKRKQHLYLVKVSDWSAVSIASVYSSIRYRDETRCDMHPRWRHDGQAICFDGAPDGHRQVFMIERPDV